MVLLTLLAVLCKSVLFGRYCVYYTRSPTRVKVKFKPVFAFNYVVMFWWIKEFLFLQFIFLMVPLEPNGSATQPDQNQSEIVAQKTRSSITRDAQQPHTVQFKNI